MTAEQNLDIDALIERIALCQTQGDAFFPDGIFPSYRHNKYLFYLLNIFKNWFRGLLSYKCGGKMDIHYFFSNVCLFVLLYFRGNLEYD
jgi:hypothetical protein